MILPPNWESLSVSELARATGCTPTAVTYAVRRHKGLCPRCGAPATHGTFCEAHHKSINKARRKRQGHKAWKPGSAGRPPKHVNQEKIA